jgi:hypothetical protein
MQRKVKPSEMTKAVQLDYTCGIRDDPKCVPILTLSWVVYVAYI